MQFLLVFVHALVICAAWLCPIPFTLPSLTETPFACHTSAPIFSFWGIITLFLRSSGMKRTLIIWFMLLFLTYAKVKAFGHSPITSYYTPLYSERTERYLSFDLHDEMEFHCAGRYITAKYIYEICPYI